MNEHTSNPDPAAPASLAEGLRSAYGTPVAIPADLDRAIRGVARGRALVIAGRARRNQMLTRWGAVAGLAAAVAIAALVWPRHRPSPQYSYKNDVPLNKSVASGTPSAGSPADARDVNGDGVVDILDAFAIASAADADEEARVRSIDSAGESEKRKAAVAAGRSKSAWDINHDGVVDRRDADDVAMAAVRLSGAGKG